MHGQQNNKIRSIISLPQLEFILLSGGVIFEIVCLYHLLPIRALYTPLSVWSKHFEGADIMELKNFKALYELRVIENQY